MTPGQAYDCIDCVRESLCVGQAAVLREQGSELSQLYIASPGLRFSEPLCWCYLGVHHCLGLYTRP